MAVDRLGVAWINYHSGLIYKVSIIDGKCKQAVTTDGAPNEFGMGFVSDGPNADTEKLFVSEFNGTELAELDISRKQPLWKRVGDFTTAKNPELTGTGGGQLFGFFPEDGDGFVQEIDRTSGKLVGKRLPVGSPKGKVNAWAFAHWGGKFYIFVAIEDNSMVYELDRKTGASKRVIEHLPMRIVGAGVSTCAPLLESVPP
jgi:outer membrane protein assembly factor BamB